MRTLFFKLLLLVNMLILCSVVTFSQYNLTKYPQNPVMSGSGDGTWDKHVYATGAILFNADSNRYEMFYCGSYGPPSWYPFRVGLATSVDGINWNKYPGNPVLVPDPGTWDAGSIEMPSVILENGQYKMWYSGFPTANSTESKIGYATSPDGINWTKDSNKPVFIPGIAAWEAGGVYAPAVIPVDTGGYVMYYQGWHTGVPNDHIGRATSPDGINWQRDTVNNPVISPGVSTEWDRAGVVWPTVVKTNDVYYMYYSGYFTPGGNDTKFGLATSTDEGVTWTKYSGNPLLFPGPSGTWDSGMIQSGGAVLAGDSLFYLWYSATNISPWVWQIGLATSPYSPVSVDYETIKPKEYSLLQNFPNPFNPATRIKYQISSISQVVLKVYDVLGKEVAVLVNEKQPAGSYEVEFDGSRLASGIYLYKLQAGDYTSVKKMILLR